MASSSTSGGLKRGRPKREDILAEIDENQSMAPEDKKGYKCPYCTRHFPRIKSLNNHIKTHTGEKNYPCTYPGCGAEFRQSGHLRTHVKIHTGEKPFRCPIPGCPTRYIHSNRNCSIHSDAKLIRDGQEKIRYPEHPTPEERSWFQEHEAKLTSPFKRQRTGSVSSRSIEEKLTSPFKRQRTGSVSSRSTDSFDLIVSTSSSDTSNMGRLVIDETDQRVPSFARPDNFIWNKENSPSGSTTPQSLFTDCSSSPVREYYSASDDNSRSSLNRIYFNCAEIEAAEAIVTLSQGFGAACQN